MIGPEDLEILQPLGADQATFVARETSTAEPRLVIVERVTRASPVPAARAELLRRGRALRALEHPKVVRVRDVFERDGEVLVVSDYVDGEWLSSLMMMNPRPPMSILLRLVIDVLEGLAALHDLKDERDKPLGFVHGAVGPDTVLVADDGVAEIARACRLPRPGTNERYVAPELRRGDEPPAVGADVYAAGAILRDMLAGAPGEASWAEPLTDIAWRACSVDVENRWPSAAAMATGVRRIAGPRLATAATVADFVRKRFGEKMHARRAAFEAIREGVPPSSEPLSLKPSEMEVVDPSEQSLGGTGTPPLPLVYPETPPPPVPKKPALILEPQPAEPVEAVEPEPETTRRIGTTTQRGLAAIAPPTPVAAPPAPLPPAAAKASLPPPTIVPDEPPVIVDQIRRQMPTFPTIEREPSRRKVALQGIVIAAGMTLTFGLGWWLAKTHSATSGDAPSGCPSVAAQAVAPPPPVLPVALPPTSTATSAMPEASVPSAPPSSTASSATPTATPTTTAPSHPVEVPVHMAPTRPVATAPVPTGTATAAPTAAPKPPPKPSASGYVPEEL